MKELALLRPLMVQRLLDTDVPKENCDFKFWVSSGQFIIRSVPSTTEINIEINNEYDFSQMLAYDSCRMASAAYETMVNIQASPHLPQSYGWIAIKCYYAAFFAAHSIMRCFGYTCSQLEKGQTKLLKDYASTLGVVSSISVERGFFAGKYDQSNRIFTLKKMKNTHEDTWHWFVECLKLLSKDVLKLVGVTKKKQELSAEIDDLIRKLNNEGRAPKGNYLSQFRNAVNYRQEFHSWHPYGKNSIKSEKIISLISNWKSKEIPNTSTWKESKDAYKFFSTCLEVVNISYLLMYVIIENSTTTKNLYTRWPNKLLQITSAA